ncbi:hypothetical protein MPSI1_000505 [Malassezia psittaci]|uniref:Uncharacterized protein n=1 Tax=Malassezia psittaci TaxID=1821823 RepID=A0AAF0F886_9BASI|nr:hypothetical protein MPSI1_000505 [Malassezia psittaci]
MAQHLASKEASEVPEAQGVRQGSFLARLKRSMSRKPEDSSSMATADRTEPVSSPRLTEKLAPESHTPIPVQRLHFANLNAAQIRPEDLPPGYDPSENYRGLDDYVNARRNERRRIRRQDRRSKLAHLQHKRSSDEESYSSDSSTSSSSSSSAPLGMARLRAFFGYDSESSSSSSSSDSESSSSSHTSDDDRSVVSSANRSVSDHDGASIISRRSRHVPHEESAITDSPAMNAALSVFNPRLHHVRQAKIRRRAREQRKRDKKYLQKASRKARRNARRLREITGGITEYALYTPMAPGQDPWVVTQSWHTIYQRWHNYFLYHRQLDSHAGDLGAPQESDLGELRLPSPALPASVAQPSFDYVEKDQSWYDKERDTGQHMSDVPLTPHLRDISAAQNTRRTAPISEDMQISKVPIITEENELLGDDGYENLLGDPMLSLPEKIPQRKNLPPLAEILPPKQSLSSDLQSNPWWLDVRCPTYKDMQELSSLFPLHPLTVEDILKQEPREKVENFDRLGYYFVVLRALDENYFRFMRSDRNEVQISPKQIEKDVGRNGLYNDKSSDREAADVQTPVWEIRKDAQNNKEGLEGLNAGSVSLYLVVFSHGVISFHFEDVQKHIDNVRFRLRNHVIPADNNAEWIVHAIYDSVVDAFLPYVTFLAVQEGAIEALGNNSTIVDSVTPTKEQKKAADLYRGLLSYVFSARKKKSKNKFSAAEALRQSRFIFRLSETREIVTGLFRLLNPKNDVLRGLRKRLSDARSDASDEHIILLYLDDIFDHVSMMVNQLQERDNALAHMHSIFLVSSQTSNKEVQIRMIRYLVIASSVATATLLCQLSTSTFSLNIKIPADAEHDYTYNHYIPFGSIVAFLCMVPFILYTYYRFVDRNARRKYERANARR